MQLCELCDRPLPTTDRCPCSALNGPCAAVSAFGAYRLSGTLLSTALTTTSPIRVSDNPAPIPEPSVGVPAA